jgi:two-component system cell cycle sensor histidine kinase/response regulator CckA
MHNMMSHPALLLVEDNPGDAELVTEMLDWPSAPAPYAMRHVTRLSDAEQILRTSSIDVVLLDLRLPDAAGVECVHALLAISRATPIIVLSGLSDETLALTCIDAGAQDYLNKEELRPTLLRRTIDRSITRMKEARATDALRRQFERLVGSIPDAVVVVDHRGTVLFGNDAALALFDRARKDFIGDRLGFELEDGLMWDVTITRGDERRACETRVVDCEWNGAPARLALIHDMTEQKRLDDHLKHAQKMEAIGLIAGGIAHDFNNLLAIMLVYAEMLRTEFEADDPRLLEVIEIVHSIDRAQGLTRQLLAFSRKQASEPAVLNLNEVVASVHSMLRRTLPASIETVVLPADHIWPVLADKGQLEQVLMNLAVNARDAMPSGGRLAIEIENRSLSGAEHEPRSGDFVALRITDTGSGIAPEHLDRIFDPFFTTKARGHGTGLGLAMCYGIIGQAGGSLTVESKLGVGTSFLILLPRTHRTEHRATAVEAETAALRGRETILVVEDDQAVMRAAAAALTRGGYTVLTAANGDEARRLVLNQHGSIDLVLSDVVMPQLSGPELAEFLSTMSPELPLIFMTGYSNYPITTESGERRIANHRAIMKPFRPNVLLSTVREVLDSTASRAHTAVTGPAATSSN